jgi:hypothetical protein
MTAAEEPVDLLGALQRAIDRHRSTAGTTAGVAGATNRPSEGRTARDGVSTPQKRSQTVTYGCGGCDNRWPGVSRAHCSGCHRTFAAFGLFDRHRRIRGEVGSCLDPESITARSRGGEERRVMFLIDGIWSSVEERGESIGDRRRSRP